MYVIKNNIWVGYDFVVAYTQLSACKPLKSAALGDLDHPI